jgi:methyl coenzyme M reductase subunit C
MKTNPVGVELFPVDGQMDMTKLIVAFRNFANAPKNHRIIIDRAEKTTGCMIKTVTSILLRGDT